MKNDVTAALLMMTLSLAGTAWSADPMTAREGSPPAPSPTAAPGEGFAPKCPWLGDACKQEFTTLCGALRPNSRREDIVRCLKEHPDQLSHECQSAIADRPPGAGRFASQGQSGHHHGGRGRRGPAGGDGMSNPASTANPDSTSEATRIFGEP